MAKNSSYRNGMETIARSQLFNPQILCWNLTEKNSGTSLHYVKEEPSKSFVVAWIDDRKETQLLANTTNNKSFVETRVKSSLFPELKKGHLIRAFITERFALQFV